jgi:NAD(P)-dependent dehydrogenase (short-subunit alcohol dehydrogenase family)
MDTTNLKGRTAVVTGGAGGIGIAIVERLQSLGARVGVWDLHLPLGLDQSKREFWKVDVTNEKDVVAAATDTLRALGSIDIFVNNAGITGPTEPFQNYKYSDWKRTIEVNLSSVFLCMRAVVPAMRANGYGRIVNISSVAGKEGNPLQPAYSAAKAGVIALTKSVARELAETGVLVNCVTPALIDTDLLKQMSEESLAFSRSKIPMKRLGLPSEVANMVAWLCSEQCSFSTGATFDLSGGR